MYINCKEEVDILVAGLAGKLRPDYEEERAHAYSIAGVEHNKREG